jgi:hypothetical protein
MLLLFLSSAAATATRAQTPVRSPETPGVEVREISWRKEVHNPMLDKDPFVHNREQWEREREQIAIDKVNVVRAKQGKPTISSNRDRVPTKIEVAPEGPLTTYVYKAKVTNTEAKTIRAVEWDYIFYDPSNELEVGRHRHRSEVKIQPGKSAGLSARSASPPTKVINISRTAKKLKEQYAERVVILSIEYADGSVWNRPAK